MRSLRSIVRSPRSRMLCEAYEVGWAFFIALEQQQSQSQPHKNLAASDTGEDPSFNYLLALKLVWVVCVHQWSKPSMQLQSLTSFSFLFVLPFLVESTISRPSWNTFQLVLLSTLKSMKTKLWHTLVNITNLSSWYWSLVLLSFFLETI